MILEPSWNIVEKPYTYSAEQNKLILSFFVSNKQGGSDSQPEENVPAGDLMNLLDTNIVIRNASSENVPPQ